MPDMILEENDGRIAVLTLNLPEQRNPISDPDLIDDLLATEASARLACQLEGGLLLRLGGGAKLRIDSAVLRGPRAGVVLRDLGVGGPLLLEKPPAPAAAPVSVLLPWARIGVRSTSVWGGVLDNVGAVFVARGRVVVRVPPLSSTSPRSRIAARCAPRAITETGVPAISNRAASTSSPWWSSETEAPGR